MAIQECYFTYRVGDPDQIISVRGLSGIEYTVLSSIGEIFLLQSPNGKYLAGILNDDSSFDLLEELASDEVYVSPALDEKREFEDNSICLPFENIYDVIKRGEHDLDGILILSEVVVFVDKCNDVLTCKPLVLRTALSDNYHIGKTFLCTGFSFNKLYLNDVECVFDLRYQEVRSKCAYKVQYFYYRYPYCEEFGTYPYNEYTAYQVTKPGEGVDGEWEIYDSHDPFPSVVGIRGIELLSVNYHEHNKIVARMADGTIKEYNIKNPL